MAKQLVRQYIFTPGGAGSGTIQIPGNVRLEQILVITNVTRNTVIYNFASNTFSGTTVSFTRGNSTAFPSEIMRSDGVTTITLAYSTTGMASTDVLQIYTENAQGAVITRPWALGTDAFERTRMAQPQSMIDADFEYGQQPTKWQTLSQLRGYPGIYETPGTDLSVAQITSDASWASGFQPGVESLITVTTNYPHGLTTGSAVTVNALLQTVASYDRAGGSFIVDSVTSSTQFSYYAKGQVGASSGTVISQQSTVVRKGGFYTGSSLTNVTFVVSGSGASSTGTITVTSTDPHGFMPGDPIIAVINSDNGSNNHKFAQGPSYISSVPSTTTFTYPARNVGTITGTPTGFLYPRTDSYYYHRPFDGGVQLGTGGPAPGMDAIRQSKKYLRYQSGKGINYNTGALFAPNYNIRSITAAGTTPGSIITIVLDDNDHGCQAGAVVVISSIGTSGYNGTYTVNSIVDERTLTVLATTTLGSTTPTIGAPGTLSIQNWYGATVRAGTFDDQNGVYWQYDGQQMAIGQRTSTANIIGLVTATIGSHVIQGGNSRYTQQLTAGDRIVLKGMTHVVTGVPNDNTLYVNPEFRGAINTNGAKIVKIQDKLVPQSAWNMDRCDGSNGIYNPSGYQINVNKMQMIGLQWTWYGAGFIDWMLRGPDGNYITVHRMKNSNVNTEAYMRTGNMPVRYQVINEGWHSTLTNSIGTTDTVMTVTDATYFPQNGGNVMIDQEIINYTSVTTTTNTLNGLTRAYTLNQFTAGQLRAFTGSSAAAHTAGTGVILVGQTASPQLSHWGSAFLADGGFDDDRGYIFNYVATNVQVSTIPVTTFAIRLAPSVSNAIPGDLGVRDLINRAQMRLQALEVTAGGSTNTNCAMVVQGVINPQNYPSNFNNINWQSLGNTGLQTGQPSFSQIAQGQGIIFDNTATNSYTVSGTVPVNSNILTLSSTNGINPGDAVYITNDNGARITGGTVVTYINPSTNQVTLSNYTIGQINNFTTINFTRTGFAQPGETVFSFVSSPQERDVLDLSNLKELTNTPIGGRNCYPNGPDVLFVNVYLTSGNPIYANLTLRWGEPQA